MRNLFTTPIVRADQLALGLKLFSQMAALLGGSVCKNYSRCVDTPYLFGTLTYAPAELITEVRRTTRHQAPGLHYVFRRGSLRSQQMKSGANITD
jgi:hypothetical protein